MERCCKKWIRNDAWFGLCMAAGFRVSDTGVACSDMSWPLESSDSRELFQGVVAGSGYQVFCIESWRIIIRTDVEVCKKSSE